MINMGRLEPKEAIHCNTHTAELMQNTEMAVSQNPKPQTRVD